MFRIPCTNIVIGAPLGHHHHHGHGHGHGHFMHHGNGLVPAIRGIFHGRNGHGLFRGWH